MAASGSARSCSERAVLVALVARTPAAPRPRHRTGRPVCNGECQSTERSRRRQPGQVIDRLARATRGRCARMLLEVRQLGRPAPPAAGAPAPGIQTGARSALSSQNRTNTVGSTQATAAWVTRSSRHRLATPSRCARRSAPRLVLLRPGPSPLGVGRDPSRRSRSSTQDLPLQVVSQRRGSRHDESSGGRRGGGHGWRVHGVEARRIAGCGERQGRPSITAPWCPAVAARAARCLVAGRAARSVQLASMVQVAVAGQRGDLGQ